MTAVICVCGLGNTTAIQTIVSVVGMIHGLLWVALVFALYVENSQEKLSMKQSLIVLTMSTFPLGMFWVDRQLLVIEKNLSS